MATAAKPLHLSLVAILFLIVLSGTACTTIGKQIGEPITVDRVQLLEGSTSVFQVVETLGPPHHISALPGGSVMVYEYIKAAEQQFGLNLDFLGLDWFKMSFGRAKAKRQVLLLLFDDDGMLRAQDYQNWTQDLGQGFGFQLFFVALPTVDTRYLNAKPEQFLWGRAALEPLPVTLNTGQSLMSGSHGIEMRGTPDSVGQRSLEMKSAVRKKKRSE
ncbi:MAG: hypothetical protein LJE85_00225 [Gammaproteobacteria bacterium]|nr:hypothetical protein [Gammaproteobacteria bacterium]